MREPRDRWPIINNPADERAAVRAMVVRMHNEDRRWRMPLAVSEDELLTGYAQEAGDGQQ
jgi:hypothetical protein